MARDYIITTVYPAFRPDSLVALRAQQEDADAPI